MCAVPPRKLVVISGLIARADLNGRMARAIKFLQGQQRLHLQIGDFVLVAKTETPWALESFPTAIISAHQGWIHQGRIVPTPAPIVPRVHVLDSNDRLI